MLLDSGGLENYNLGSFTHWKILLRSFRGQFDLCEKRSTRQERQKGNPHAVPPLFFESFVYSAFSRPNRNVTTPHSWMLSMLSSPPPAAAGGRLTGSASPAAGPDTEQPSRSSGSPET
ncbi:predicted protein [Histoplasma capsulatum var. duboisii H88]|uniref:Predicted protein n=1 Tax=Ajellomyces capsulatus (strain H88) TaxID=544711 RepID=F0URQ7_AJEC8|nr:predicted protein [Histoplasma capsulatum var. duboisii H88]